MSDIKNKIKEAFDKKPKQEVGKYYFIDKETKGVISAVFEKISFPKSISIDNQKESVKIEGGVKINNLKDLDGLEVTIKNQIDKVKIDSEVEIKKPNWYKEFNDNDVISAISNGFKWLAVNIKEKLQEVSLSRHTRADNALAVKIYDVKGKIVSDFGGASFVGSPSGGGSMGILNVNNTKINPATEETLQSIAGFNIPAYNQILATYPDTSTEVYTYKLSGVSVGVITVVYSDAVTKNVITSVSKT